MPSFARIWSRHTARYAVSKLCHRPGLHPRPPRRPRPLTPQRNHRRQIAHRVRGEQQIVEGELSVGGAVKPSPQWNGPIVGHVRADRV